MDFLFDVSITFLRKTTTNTRKINYYRNQVILNKLSASKIETRLNVSRRQKTCHSVTKSVTALRCLFSFFERMITIRRKFFLSFESSFRALQHWFQVHFIWRLPFAGNWKLSSSTGKWGSFFVTVLRDYKTFLYTK